MVHFFRSINSLVWLSSTLYTDVSFIHNSASGCTKHRTVNHGWLRAVNLLLTFGESGLHFMAFDRFIFEVLWWQWLPWERKLGCIFVTNISTTDPSSSEYWIYVIQRTPKINPWKPWIVRFTLSIPLYTAYTKMKAFGLEPLD